MLPRHRAIVKKILRDYFVQARPVSLHGLRIKLPVANSVRIFGSVCAAADATFAVRVVGARGIIAPTSIAIAYLIVGFSGGFAPL